MKESDQGAVDPCVEGTPNDNCWKVGSIFWLYRNGRMLSLGQQLCTTGMAYLLLCCCQDRTVHP